MTWRLALVAAVSVAMGRWSWADQPMSVSAPNPATMVKGPTLPDLSEFRTVDNAATTTLKAAAQAAAKAETAIGHLGARFSADSGGHPVVADLEDGSSGAKAGLAVGDIVYAAGGKSVAGVDPLRALLRTKAAGDKLNLVVLRGTKFRELDIPLAAPSRPLSLTPGGRGIMGVQVTEAEGGAKVAQLTPNLPAAQAGLKIGDLIVRIDKAVIGSPEQLTGAMTGKKPGETVVIVVKRDGAEKEFPVKLASDPNDRPRRQEQGGGMPIFKKDVYRLAIIGIEYPDVKHNDKISPKEWERALFSRNEYLTKNATGGDVFGSMNDYYVEQSCGKFRVEGKAFDYVPVSRKKAEYGNDANRFALLTEALDKLLEREGKDALKGFDGLFFLYAGPRQAAQRGGLYWPHRSTFLYKLSRWNYYICPEGGAKMDSISILTHEFGHLLGMPDLYARPEVPGMEGLGVWCTMSTGHGTTGKPLHFSAWCKEQLGWLKPTLIDPAVPQKLILAPIEDSDKECYKVLIRPDGSEYLLLENRRRRGFDRELPAEGLLIWRVVDGRVMLEESHGILGPAGPDAFRNSVPYPSPSNNSFTPDTIPSSKPIKEGGLPVHITDIRKLPDGRITFQIGYEYQ